MQVSKETVLKVLVPAVAAIAVIFATNSYGALLVLPLIIAVSLTVALCDRGAALKKRKRKDMESLSRALNFLDSSINGQEMTTIKSIGTASKRVNDNKPVSSMLSRLRSRMLLGQDLQSATASERGLAGTAISEVMERVGRESSSGGMSNSLRTAYGKLYRDSLVRRELSMGSNQRYLIISMVFSTILPSLAVFGFIGYSILSYSESQFLIFSTVLLSVLPGISSIVRMRLNED